ncbi:MAG: GNAT family acetyltransferase [Candidatus Electryonea clarkiae]|nr:GNAT family acetyltransferase [Candidatus Electryonea clarkiae]MDP8288805.1 GNAT family acetyltransferase [Candidatus Electryonea clarkiae]
MNLENLVIRQYCKEDEIEVVSLWRQCDLVVPWNNPHADIKRKLEVDPEMFLVATLEKKIVATCMAGYEGHRGWINYLAVSPGKQRRGIANRIMEATESILRDRGCPKINLQIRFNNKAAVKFYDSIGFSFDDVLSMGKRLNHDEP